MNQAAKGEDVAGSGKFEFLIKGTEMAFSAWGKKKFHPVYGYDFSTRFLGIDLKGEASFSRGSNTTRVVKEYSLFADRLVKQKEDSNIYKGSLNIGRDFDFGDKTDRINISIEGFYNGDGYAKNPVDDKGTYIYDEPVTFEKDGTTVSIPGGNMKTYLLGHGLYEANYFSKYYA